ncbi:MAG: IMP dehydrogenase [Legionellales bacterium]|jgi:IMP dehydrogenase|nr:IMP dehydrogenase [Legionellales bacterium]|tara:strand:+ start:2005 stop:3465 length:1461 start_codon:yes stop_codon:yes gene_type:complete
MKITEEALTFDDVLLVPDYSEILPRQASLQTQLTRDIKMNIPLVSAAMDTVTESELAIALAQEGGVGIIHKNMDPELQAKNVRRVKKYESGIIQEPVTVGPYTSIQEVIDLTRQKNISGVPVVDGDELVGIVTSRDLRFEEKPDDPVRNIMTRKESLVTVEEHATKEEVRALLHKHRIEKILVVNNKFQLAGLITVKDMQKASEYPNACLDDAEQLRVGAAVGVGEIARKRAALLVESNVDVIVVDTAHGHSKGVLDMVKWIKTNFKETQVIGGNIATADAALALVKAGADAVKVGIGPGSICTTRVISGVGMPQISAVTNVAKALKNKGIPVISDGGVRYSGDLAKGLAAGANSMMVGGLFAGTEEAPGEVELYQGRSYKTYRGMGSLGAMAEKYGSSDRYFQENDEVEKLIPEGIEGRVPYKGALEAVVHQLCGGIRAALGYTGCLDLKEMRDKAKFVRLTSAGFKESHVHDVAITKEPPNYRL